MGTYIEIPQRDVSLTVSNYVDLVKSDKKCVWAKTESYCRQEALVRLFYKCWKTTRHLITSYNGDRSIISNKQNHYLIYLHKQGEVSSTYFDLD